MRLLTTGSSSAVAQILLFLKQDPEVAHKASIYLRHLSIGLPGYAINCLSKKYFQGEARPFFRMSRDCPC
mgnify:CR=1 FL=1